MRPKGSAKELERRRQRAMALIFTHDYTQVAAAEAVGVTVRTLQRWVAAYRSHGNDGIAPSETPGRPRSLDEKDLAKLEKILLKGANAYGFDNDLWTAERVGIVIEDKFGYSFHRSHVWRILQLMRWSPQKPERRAVERDEEEIEKFVKVEWKKIVKNASRRRPP